MTHVGKNRYLVPHVCRDLSKKMVFLSGPRQVGKTTMALGILGGEESHPAYFNWDNLEDQERLRSFKFPPGEKLLVLDEIHKYLRWRNWLKGLYDKTRSQKKYLVTGSARLDLYARGGDALTGRYHSYRLHPLSLSEIDPGKKASVVEDLLRLGGFPEPFYGGSETELRRWQKERKQQVLRDDLRDLEQVQEISLISLLSDRLSGLVGSPLSINALREDLQVAHQTVAHWIGILEKLFLVFRVAPFGAPKIRAVKKEQKAYLWDWSLVEDRGYRFENMMACQLLKYCHYLEDTEGYDMELRYLRDTDRREVDFVVLKNRKALFAVECKTGKSAVTNHMAYFAEKTNIPVFYLVHLSDDDYEDPRYRARVLPFHRFVSETGMP